MCKLCETKFPIVSYENDALGLLSPTLTCLLSGTRSMATAFQLSLDFPTFMTVLNLCVRFAPATNKSSMCVTSS